jgi:hypothetical protein
MNAADGSVVSISLERDVLILDGHVLIDTSDRDGGLAPSEVRALADALRASVERAKRCRSGATVISTVDLPTGRRWMFLEDCNVLALSPYLDGADRERAIAEARSMCDIR